MCHKLVNQTSSKYANINSGLQVKGNQARRGVGGSGVDRSAFLEKHS